MNSPEAPRPAAPPDLRDPALPGLRTALDTGAVLELLRAELPEVRAGLELVEGRITDVQYFPGERCAILLRLKVQEEGSGRTRRQQLAVHVLGKDEPVPRITEELRAQYAARRRRRGPRRESPLETPALAFPEIGLAIHAFPLDPFLPRLMDVVDPDAVRRALHRAWTPRHVRVRRVRCRTLSYTPESRAALQYEVLAEHKDTGVPELRRLVGKLHARRPPSRLFAGAWAVWRRTGGRAAVAPPVGYVDTLHLQLQELLAGRRLADLAGGGSFLKPVRQAARGIAHVHSLALPLHSVRTAEREGQVVRRWTSVLEAIRPRSADRIAALRDRILGELAARISPTATVHADFHPANVMADADGVTLIDWDQIARGDPMVDVGRFLGSLRVSALRILGDPEGLADAGQAFLDAYVAVSGADERRARLFESVALLIAAAGPFRLQREGWEEGADRMLDLCEGALDSACRGASVRVGSAETVDVAFADRCEWGRDRAFVQALLAPHLRARFGDTLELTDCLLDDVSADSAAFEARYHVKGWKDAGRWRRRLVGRIDPKSSLRGAFRRLERLDAAAAGTLVDGRLPRAVAYLAQLGMLAQAPPDGEAFVGRLEGVEAPALVRSLAELLAALQELSLEPTRARDATRDVEAMERRVERLAEDGHPLGARARPLVPLIEAAVARGGESPGVELIDLRLRDLIVTEGGDVALARVHDVGRAHRLAAAGSVIAQLTRRELRREEGRGLCGEFRRAYLQATGADAGALAAWEAWGLVRWACREARQHAAADDVAASLLARASERLP